MRNIRAPLAVLCLVILSACASGLQQIPAVDQFANTFEGVCALWQKIREHYPQIKEAAILLHELGGIDEETWTAVAEVGRDAPKYDRWMQLLCDAQAGAANGHVIAAEKASVDWDRVGSVVLKAAVFAMELKARGAI